MSRLSITEDGVRAAFSDEAFLEQLVDAVPELDLYEAFDHSDAWWWLCAKYEAMRRYKRTDLQRTALTWIRRVRVNEVLQVREDAEAGKFDHLLPEGLRERARDSSDSGVRDQGRQSSP